MWNACALFASTYSSFSSLQTFETPSLSVFWRASVALLVSSKWCMLCGCHSWFIFLRPGETVRWPTWIQTSLIVTASQPVALTVKRATWWTTATVAWCTCLVGSRCFCMLRWKITVSTSKKLIDMSVCFFGSRRCTVLHPRALQRMCWPSSW